MYIYKTTNIINDKIYVGMSKYNPSENPKYLGSGCLLKKAIKRYGIEYFKKEILEICESEKEMRERERYWIKKLDSRHRDKGYNISEGGDWGDVFKFHPRKEEIREIFKKKYRGENNPNYGNKWSKKQKEKASKYAKKHQYAIDKKTGLNIAQTEEARKKISESKMGLKNPNGVLWELVSPDGKIYLIDGGIKHKIEHLGEGLNYQQFHYFDEENKNVRWNRQGWKLIKKTS